MLSIATVAIGLVSLASPAPAQVVEIAWDERGVPHVRAPSDEAVFFGQGYAMAVDRLGQMHWIRQSAKGELEALLGSNDIVAGTLTPSFMDDVFRSIRTHGEAQERYEKLDAATRSALQAFAAGVNKRIAELGTLTSGTGPSVYLPKVLEEFDFSTGAFPAWQPYDSVACWDWFSMWFTNLPYEDATNLVTSKIPVFAPVDEVATVIQETEWGGDEDDLDDYLAEYYAGPDACGAISDDSPPSFSHAWAIAGSKADSATAILQAEPRITVFGPNIMHEVHLINTAAVAGFDVRGAGVTGAPFLFQGFNADVAWGAASLGADLADVIKVVPHPSDPSKYMYDEHDDGTAEAHDFTMDPVTGATLTKFGTVWPDAGQPSWDWVLRSVFEWDALERHSLQASLRMIKSGNCAEFRQAAKYWISPAVHCVFADSQGSIGYSPLLALATRGSRPDYPGFAGIEDGSDPEDDWQRTVPYDLLPWTIKTDGEIIIANNRPAGCWYGIRLDYSLPSRPTDRWLRLWELVVRDEGGLAPFDAEETAAMSLDPVATLRRMVRDVGVHIADDVLYDLSTAADAGLAAIRNWGGTSYVDDAGFEHVCNLEFRLKEQDVPELVATYGPGPGGAISLARALIERDLGSNPLSPSTSTLDQEIVDYYEALLAEAAAADPVSSSLDLPYFGNHSVSDIGDYEDSLGAMVPSADSSKDITNIPMRCFDSTTVWSPTEKVYSHTVDFDDVNSSKALHAPGNHEDPNHPTLGAAFDNEALNPAWTDGAPASGSTLDLLGDAPLTWPTTTLATKGLNFRQSVTYYGTGYSGADPERALSIEIVGDPSTIHPGDSFDVRVSGLPESNYLCVLGIAGTKTAVPYQGIVLYNLGEYATLTDNTIVDGVAEFTNLPSSPTPATGYMIVLQAIAYPTGGGATELLSTEGMEFRILP
jgi:hypothetical protein